MPAKFKKGFTLIELLIVIAILGILATVVLVAMNPVEQMARTRDAGRKSTIGQLGHALEAYATSHESVYIPEAGWTSAAGTNTLVVSGEISSIPSQVASKTGYVNCATVAGVSIGFNGWCYNATTAATGAGPVVLYTKLESKTEISKCAALTPVPWYVHSSADSRAGLICLAAAANPVPGAQTWNAVQ